MEIDPPAPPAAQGGEGGEAASAMPTAEETALQCASDHDLRVAYYCEENVWRLAYRMRHHLHGNHHHYSPDEDTRFWVVFISNVIKSVPFFHQRTSQDPNKSVCWDYHVILIGNTTSSANMQHHHHDEDDDNIGETTMMVYDIDSRLPYPCPLHQYLQQSFPYEWPEPYNPMFRVIPADRFLSHFSSDRSHMINRQTGEWNAPPPPYAPITGGHGDDAAIVAVGNNNNNNNNLQHYLNFVGRPHRTEIDEEALGQILNKQQLAAAEFARD